MSSSSQRTRTSRLPVLLLGLSLVSVGGIAVQAWVSERAREREREAALAGYADIVAFQTAGAAYTLLSQELQLPFTALERASAEVRGVEFLLDFPSEAERCAGLGEARWAGRVGIPDAWNPAPTRMETAEWHGSVPDEAERLRLLTAALARLDDLEKLWSVFVVELGEIPEGGGTVPIVVASSKWRPGPEGSSLYLLRSCLDLASRSLFDVTVSDKLLLPESVFGTVPRTELFRFTIATEDGTPVWHSHPGESAEGPPRRFPFEEPVEMLNAGVALTDAGRASLAPGPGSGSTRLAMIGGLFLLNAILLVAAIVQLRRERELLRLRERFVASVSHELRTPLQQMLLFGDLLRLDRFDSPSEQQRAVSVVSRETRRLIHLVENVLAFRSGDAPSVPTRASQPWPLDDFVRDVVEEFDLLAEARRVSVEVEAGCGREVEWHPDAVRRVLLNLLDNAAKYAPSGSTVTVRTACDGDRVRISVTDGGPGIPAAERARVLEPYRRGEGDHVRTTGGSGIGLSIVRELVEQAGGRLELGDAPGGGLEVRVEVPSA